MRSLMLSLAGAAMAIGISAMPAFADSVPCEDKLAAVREALKNAALDDAKKAEVDALMEKGIERCNADDDARANDFFAQIETILGQ